MSEQEMKHHPLACSDWEVLAFLAGSKTQFRRVIKMAHRRGCPWAYDENDDTGYEWVEADPDLSDHDYRQPCRCIRCPYGQPGDRLWVRECFAYGGGTNGKPIVYRADWPGVRRPCDSGVPYGGGFPDEKWSPSIHMPRWASRLTLELVDVRAEQVQGISEEDAIAEGLVQTTRFGAPAFGAAGWAMDRYVNVAAAAFCDLWDSAHADRGLRFDANPWAWVGTVRRVDP